MLRISSPIWTRRCRSSLLLATALRRPVFLTRAQTKSFAPAFVQTGRRGRARTGVVVLACPRDRAETSCLPHSCADESLSAPAFVQTGRRGRARTGVVVLCPPSRPPRRPVFLTRAADENLVCALVRPDRTCPYTGRFASARAAVSGVGWCRLQSTGSPPARTSSSLARLKGRDPKKPAAADKGEGERSPGGGLRRASVSGTAHHAPTRRPPAGHRE